MRTIVLLTEVSDYAIFKTVAEYVKEGKVHSPLTKLRGGRNLDFAKTLNGFDRFILKTIVHNVCERKEIPTRGKLALHLKESEYLPNPSPEALSCLMRKLGFRYRRRSKNSYLIEVSNLVQWRCRYLREIRKFHQDGRAIYYSDVAWVNAGHQSDHTRGVYRRYK